jgi:hypothetical protein
MNALTLLLGVLLAQEPLPSAYANPEAKPRAQALLKEGSALFEQGDYQAALEKFREAYATYPSPKLQFNIAQANRDLGRPVEALGAYELFLTLATDASPETLSDARRSVAELQASLGQLKIDCSPSGSEVTIDGKSVGLTPLRQAIWSVPGYHQVTIRHQQFVPAIETVEIVKGRVQTLTMKLHPSAAPALPPLALSAQTPPPEAEVKLTKHDDERTLKRPAYRTYFWTGVGTTGALVLGAVIAGAAANSKFSDLQNSCGRTPAGCPESQIDMVKTRVHVANIFWALAGTAAVATGFVFYMDNRETGASISWMF